MDATVAAECHRLLEQFEVERERVWQAYEAGRPTASVSTSERGCLREPGSGRRGVVGGGLGVAACGAGRAGNRGPC
jgi:hypothetical protein